MAYDYGSSTLGIKNPFRLEGILRSIAGALIIVIGVYALFKVSSSLQINMIRAWMNAICGFILIGWGIKHTAIGLFQVFRFFVGRSVPRSLAFNRNRSERENAEIEKDDLAYSHADLESMLMGRKNPTFVEPIGWIARLVHSIFRRLIFLPYPIRNFAQNLAEFLIVSLSVVLIYGIVFYVSLSGLAGEAGKLITPVLTMIMFIHLVLIWLQGPDGIKQEQDKKLYSKDTKSLSKIIVIAILVPILVGYVYHSINTPDLDNILTITNDFNNIITKHFLVILLILVIALISLLGLLILFRTRQANPLTEVSEFRDNFQESVHPNEIFINIENIVLANRRYKEIPNRIYQEFDPILQEQSQGKGNFKGQLLIETQPEFFPFKYGTAYKAIRFFASLIAQILFVYVAYTLLGFFNSIADISAYIKGIPFMEPGISILDELIYYSPLLLKPINLFLSVIIFYCAARLLANGTHLFWAELQFSSLLMWLKTEGTFTESKISTGMAIHDSTRSENVVVRSSITPWIISSRIVSSTFATSGSNNLELRRFVMTMNRNNDELATIVDEIKSFLRGRESIASIRNELDLGNAETIYQINQTSRAHERQQNNELIEEITDDHAVGKLIRDEEAFNPNHKEVSENEK